MNAALLCLALNSFHEARGEPLHGQVAVAQVVMRRAGMDDRKVCKVVYAPRQFSWTRGKPRVNGVPPRTGLAWGRAVFAAQKALLWSKGVGEDHSAGADHYHALRVKPGWARAMWPVRQIGEHVFYRSK